MGKPSRWTCAVILLCLCGVGLCQNYPVDNAPNGFRNVPSKLNIRNIFGSKLVQRLADSQQTVPQYEPYPYERVAQPLPPPPPPPSRGMIPYEYQNQRVQVQAPVRAPPPQIVGQPQAINEEDVYTETITSTCPCPECEAAAAAAEANQNYSYQDERDSYVEEGCPCERGCPCGCDEGYIKGSPCPCGSRCPYAGEPGYQSDRDYPEEEPHYEDYNPPGDCPCNCAGNQDCPCAYGEGAEEAPPPAPSRQEPTTYRSYTPVNQINRFEGQPEPPIQRHSEGYGSAVGQAPYQPPPPPPPPPIQKPIYRQYAPVQYDDVPEQTQYIKLPPRILPPVQRTFAPHPDCPEAAYHQPPQGIPQAGIPQMRAVHERVIQRTHVTEVAERPIQQVPPHMMGQPLQDNVYSEPGCPCESCSECEAAQMQHGHIPEVPQRGAYHEHPPRIPVQSYQEPVPRLRGWRRRIPPPRIFKEEEIEEEEEPPVPIYRSYKPILNRRQRKYKQSGRPPFFEDLSYSDGC